MYIYVTKEDVKRMKTINSNENLNELLQEALQVDKTILIEEQYYYTIKKGYKGFLFGKKEKNFRYTLYHESPAHDGSAYQALHMFCANKDLSTIFAYLYGIINGGSAISNQRQEEAK